MRFFVFHEGVPNCVQCIDLPSRARLGVLLQQLNALIDGPRSREIPEQCVKKLFGDTDWNNGSTRDWPDHIKVPQ